MVNLNDTTSATGGTGREVVCLTVQAEPLKPRAGVRHDSSYVAQLLMHADDLPNIPQRRRADRRGAFSAYAAADAAPAKHGLTRRIA